MRPRPADAVARARRTVRAAVGAARRPVQAGWRRWLVDSGVDDTVASMGRRTLVVVPHPDDETIGCGATIARKRACGTPVDIVVVCDGRRSHDSAIIAPAELARIRRKECLEACERLGVDAEHVVNLGFEELTLWRCLDDLAVALGKVVEATAPEELLVIAGQDWHPDHQAVHAAMLRALARSPFSGVVRAFPVWFWADGPWTSSPQESLRSGWQPLLRDPLSARRLRDPRLVRTDGFIEVKREAFARYRSQLENLTGEPSWATLEPSWFDAFCGPYEVFFPVEEAEIAGAFHLTNRSDCAGRPGQTDRGDLTPATAQAGRPDRPDRGYRSEVLDTFDDDRLPGTVIGTTTRDGATRLGVDAEGSISIDNGAARFATLDLPGWGRQGLSYGPFRRRGGLTVGVQLLNSHNTAQSNVLDEGRRALVGRYMRHFPHASLHPEFLTDNLAVGFFPAANDPGPAAPPPHGARVGGNAFVMHAGGTLNGELRAGVAGGHLRAHLGIQELPVLYLVVLREEGAAYYAASVPGAAGLGHHPMMRPIAIDHAGRDDTVFAGAHQAVHAEVFHQISSRVQRVQVGHLAEFGRWCGTAFVADRFAASGLLDGAPIEVGDATWTVTQGALAQVGGGLAAPEAGGEARTTAPGPVGLIHLVFETAPIFAETGRAGLAWRLGPDGRGWRVEVGPDEARLTVDGPLGPEIVASARCRVEAARRYSLQVLDDGCTFSAHLDGVMLFDGWTKDDRFATEHGVGLISGPGSRSTIRSFEAHPRAVPIPASFDPGPPWQARGSHIVLHDRFEGPPGEPTDGTGAAAAAGMGWERSFGQGRFVRSGRASLVVQASAERPNPGRTLYTVPWPDEHFADIEVTMLPPGTGRGEGEAGRGGLVFWQDPSSYVVLNMWLDDWEGHDGSSISMFLCAAGRERLYDAVWTNVGRRVTWGTPFTLRASCDGRQLLAWLDGEPVFYRALRDVYPRMAPLRLARVGLAANWEWGDDTGTVFTDFVARGHSRPPTP